MCRRGGLTARSRHRRRRTIHLDHVRSVDIKAWGICTLDGSDGLQVGRRSILQSESDRAAGVSPGERERLASGNFLEGAGIVGELNSLCDSTAYRGHEDLGDLHFRFRRI